MPAAIDAAGDVRFRGKGTAMLRSMVERPLNEVLVGRDGFVALIATAGAGKTTLLRQWEAADSRPFIRLAAADASDAVAIVTGATGPVVVVLDDVHRHPDGGAFVVRSLAELTLQPGIAVVVSGRAVDRRALTAMRLRPDLVDLSDADLALDERAAREVLGGHVGEEELRRVLRRTRGWAAGLQLARVALGRRSGDEDPEFTGADRVVRDYLQSEVLDDLGDELTGFLLHCAPFDELSGPLCDAVRGSSDSQELLERLEREHLFVSALDREGRTFGWLPLAREALAAELDRRDPTEAKRLRTVGADWLAAHGDARTALALRLANGDREQALHLLSEVVLPMFYAGQLEEIVGIIHAIGPDIAITHGYLATMFAYAGMMTGDEVCARRWTKAAGDFYQVHSFGDGDEQVAFLALRAHLCADGVQRMRRDAEAARVRVKESSPWRAPVLMMSGIAAGLCGDARAAHRLLEEAAHVSAELRATPALMLALSERLELDSGRVSADAIAHAVDAAEGGPFTHYPHAALGYALRAEAAAIAGEKDAAHRDLLRAHGYRAALGRELPWLAVQVRLRIARATASLGDPAGARLVLAEAEEILAGLAETGILKKQAADLAAALRPLGGADAVGASLLTSAELRLLPLLPSHLSFEEIGDRLHLSRNTIKTQARSVYRKLGVSSRSEAVQHATQLGLVSA